MLGSNLNTFLAFRTPKTDPRAPHPAAVNAFHVRTVRTREGPVARAGNPVARSLGVQNARIAVEFEIPRPARTSPRLKHATQKPTLLRQKISALIGSGIEAAPEPTNCHAMQNLIAAGGALAFLLLVCAALLHGGMRSRGV